MSAVFDKQGELSAAVADTYAIVSFCYNFDQFGALMNFMFVSMVADYYSTK